MTRPVPVTIWGAAGRMGRMLLAAALSTEGVTLAGALVRPSSPHEDEDAGPLCGRAPCGVRAVADPAAALAGAQVAIDFSSPHATADLCAAAAERGVALVIGTTGLSAQAVAAIERAAQRVPVVRSANMSLGVNVLIGLLGKVSQALPDFDVEIVELHHRLKRDAPSGTALLLAGAVAQERGLDPATDLRSGRAGLCGERPRGEIGVLAVRGGDVVGEHTAYFLGDGERVEITHRATRREIFATGALRAARWVAGRPPGCYDMQDVLGLRA